MLSKHLNESFLGGDKPIIAVLDPVERNISTIAESSYIL